MGRYSGMLPAAVMAGVLAGCGPREAAEPEAGESTAELISAPVFPAEDEARVQEIAFEVVTDELTPATIGGVYRDPAAPEVTFEIGEGNNAWRAVWQPEDVSRGLLMEGVYAIEGDLVHFRCMTFGRREEMFDDDWELRTPAHPRPRGYFRMQGNALVLVPEKTSQAFTMAPFNATKLLKVAP